jgi:hypothetical protein
LIIALASEAAQLGWARPAEAAIVTEGVLKDGYDEGAHRPREKFFAALRMTEDGDVVTLSEAKGLAVPLQRSFRDTDGK